jgi:hypothetical protein
MRDLEEIECFVKSYAVEKLAFFDRLEGFIRRQISDDRTSI